MFYGILWTSDVLICILAITEITVISAHVLMCVWQTAASLSVGPLCEYRRTHQNICICFQR